MPWVISLGELTHLDLKEETMKRKILIFLSFLLFFTIAHSKTDAYEYKAINFCAKKIKKNEKEKVFYVSVKTDYYIKNVSKFLSKVKDKKVSYIDIGNYIADAEDNLTLKHCLIEDLKFSERKIGNIFSRISIKPFKKLESQDIKVVKKESCIWLSRSNIYRFNNSVIMLLGVYKTEVSLNMNDEVVNIIFHDPGIIPQYFILYEYNTASRKEKMYYIY